MPLPEIILRKMLVPNSFRYSRTGFAFELKNTFAPGTITSFKLIADDDEIPLQKVRFQLEGQPAQTADQISAGATAAFPTHLLVTVSADHPGKLSSLVLLAGTREAGEIRFAVTLSAPKVGNQTSWWSRFRRPQEIRLDASLPVTELSPDLLGVFRKSMPSFDSAPLADRIVPLLVAPAGQNPSGAAWGNAGLDPGTNIDLLIQTSIEDHIRILPIVRPACGARNLASINHSDTPLDLLIGGDAWCEWEISKESALQYAHKVDSFRDDLRQNDRPGRVGILAKCLASNGASDPAAAWNSTLLQTLQHPVDMLYWQAPLLEAWPKPESVQQNHWHEMHDQLMAMIDRQDALINSSQQEQNVRQAIDFSKMLASLECQRSNQDSELDEMDLAFLLFSIFSACADRQAKLTFATIMNSTQFGMSSSRLAVLYEMLVNHFQGGVSCNSRDLRPVQYFGTTWSPDGIVGALSSYSEEGIPSSITLINPYPHRRVRLLLRTHVKITGRLTIASRILTDLSEKHKIYRVSSNMPHLDAPPRSITHFNLLSDRISEY